MRCRLTNKVIDMYVCLCHAVTESNIHHAVLRGACSLRDLRNELKVATQCGRCATCAKTCLNQALAVSSRDSAVTSGILPPTQCMDAKVSPEVGYRKSPTLAAGRDAKVPRAQNAREQAHPCVTVDQGIAA